MYSLAASFNKFILIICFISALFSPFEQMVFAAVFFSGLNKGLNKNTSSIVNGSHRRAMPSFSMAQSAQKTNSSVSETIHELPSPNILASDGGSLASNADNFHGAWNASVDPRTGNASFSLVVASVLYDNGRVKRDLTLSYGGGPSARGLNTFGLGPHWGFNVGTEHVSSSEVVGHRTTDIAMGNGHRFTMVSDRNQQGKNVWRPLRHKLGDVTFTGAPGSWSVSGATGVREHIVNGYADWEQARDGKRLYFYYNRRGAGDNTRLLSYVCGHALTTEEQRQSGNACAGDGIWVTYKGALITVHGNQDIILHRGENGGIGNINAIIMPSMSSDGLSNSKKHSLISFTYDDRGKRPWLLSSVHYPTGESKTFLYNEESDHAGTQTRGLAVGIRGARIPVVTEVISTAEKTGSTEKLQMKEWYRYGEVNSHGQSHNYMGYQGAGSVIPGRDNLFDRPDSYTYSVSKDNGLSTTTTTYNKYHLPQLVEQRDNQKHSLLARSEQKYIPLKGTVFAQLPGNYSLSTGADKTLYATTERGQDKTVKPARVIRATRYDNNGQKLWEQDAYGRITMTQYCPPEGNEHCPAMDKDWPQVSLPEKTVKIPARHSPGGSLPFLMMNTQNADPEPAIETVFDYVALPAATAHSKAATHLKTEELTAVNAGEHFWQVKTKTVGTLPLSAVAHLQPGDALPELSAGKLSTRTTYHYNTQLNTVTYGQLNQLSMVSYKPDTPMVRGHALVMAEVMHPAVPRETVTVNVRHAIDETAGTRTTVMTVAADSPSGVVSGAGNLSAGGDISLGTTVYSLATGSKLARQDTLKELHTRWFHDYWGRVVKQEVIPDSGGRIKTTHWQYIMTPTENAVVETVPGGQQFKKVFNSFNWEIATAHRFADQAQGRIEGRTNWIMDTARTYTTEGKPDRETIYHADDPNEDDSQGQMRGLTSTYGYDTFNRQVWKKAPDGVVSVTVRNDPAMQLFEYQAGISGKETLGALLTVTESNILGKPVARYLLPFDPGVKKQGKQLYSVALQRRLKEMVKQLLPASSLQKKNSYGLLPLSGPAGLLAFVKEALEGKAWLQRTRWEYDGNGHQSRQIQSNGAVTRWIYQQDDLVATITPDGRIIHDTFNVHGKKVSRCVQPAGSHLCHVLGTRGFDVRGNLLWQSDEYGQKLRYTRDSNGRMLSMTTPATDEAPAGHTFTYEYNSLGMTRALLDGEVYVTHRYDPNTWQLTDTGDSISHLHYTYDKNTGALITITRSAPTPSEGITPLAGISYPDSVQYMHQDRYLKEISRTDEAGNRYTSVHDKLGRVLQRRVQTGVHTGTGAETTLTRTTYDNFSRPVTVTNGRGIQRLFRYDNTGKLASTTDTLDGRVLLQLSYTYDADSDNILTLTRREGNLAATQRYSYDLQNNLTAFHCGSTNAGGASELCPRDIDIRDSGLTEPPVITDQQYSFDQWNNIHRVIERVSTDKGALTKTTEYGYADRGTPAYPDAYDPHRLLSYRTVWQGQRYSTRPAELTYDSAGRIIKDVDGNLLHYNAFGQQDRFTNAETGEVTTYCYDSDGHQAVEQFLNAAGKALQQPLYMLYRGNAVTGRSQLGRDNQLHTSAEVEGVAHSEDGVITRWYLHDYKNDVLQSYNSKAQLLGNNVYSPYGMQYDRQNNRLAGLPRALKNQSSLWQSQLPGFNGQSTDTATGYQFLGGGYRAYNPVYRQFMARDSFSPFRKINGYGFGDNNPIMNTDPTGHMPKWLGYAMGAVGIGMSLAVGILLPIAGAGISSVGMASVGLAGVAEGVIGTAYGSLQIVATKHPERKLLQEAASMIGMSQMLLSPFFFIGPLVAIKGALDAGSLITCDGFEMAMLVTGAVSRTSTSTLAFIPSIISWAASVVDEEPSEWENYMGAVTMGLMIVSMAATILGVGGLGGIKLTAGETIAEGSGGKAGAKGGALESPRIRGNNNRSTGEQGSKADLAPGNKHGGNTLPDRSRVPVVQNPRGARLPPYSRDPVQPSPPPEYSPPEYSPPASQNLESGRLNFGEERSWEEILRQRREGRRGSF